MKRTKEQNLIFHALLKELRYDKEEKAELVLGFSGGRSSSSADLTFGEMKEVIKYLKDKQDGGIKKMRSKIINIGKDLGLVKNGNIDFVALNKFLVGKFKKPLHELTRDELVKAVTAMEAWRNYNMKKELDV